MGDSEDFRRYDAPDTLAIDDAAQLKALGDEVRARIISLLGEEARSVTELAQTLGIPKGTVSHHVKVLEQAGLVRVVHSRRVRALTENFYGRVAWLFLFRSGDDAGTELVQKVSAASLRTAADELDTSPELLTNGLVRARLTPADAERFEQRLKRLLDDFRRADSPEGEPVRLVGALYRREAPGA